MAKREASGYLTKEDGLLAGPEGPNAPRMASAEILRNRKIKAPRSRLGASSSGSPFQSIQSLPNPFASSATTNGTQQPAFSTLNGAPSFGQSQSFPPTNSGSLFNFTPSTSTSFPTFGQASSSTFANTQPTSKTSGFGSFQAPQHNNDDMMEESPQKQNRFGFGTTLGGGSSGPSASATFSFGQAPSSDGPGSFGASTQPKDSPFKFGSSFQSKGPVNFGAPAESQPSSASFTFGAGSVLGAPKPDAEKSDAQTGPSSEQKSSFFNPTTEATTSPSDIIGQNTSQSSASKDAPAQPTTAVEASATISAPFSGLFGGPVMSTKTSSVPTTSSNFLGQKASDSQISTASTPFTFGQLSSTSNASTEKSTWRPVFGLGQPSSTSNASTSSAPFSSIFSQSKPQPASNSATSAAEGTKSVSPAPVFSGFTPQKDSSTQKPTFSFGQPSGTQKPSTTSTLFSAASGSTSTEPVLSKSDKVRPESTLASSEQKSTSSRSGFSTGVNSNDTTGLNGGGLFGRISQPEDTPQTPPESQSSSQVSNKEAPKPAFSFSQNQTLAGDSASKSAFPRGNTFGAPQAKNTGPEKTTSELFNFGAPATAKALSKNPTENRSSASQSAAAPNASASANPPENARVRMKTHGSSDVPGYLNNDDRAEYDKQYRLRSLNEEFQRRVAKIDPASRDFDALVGFYCGVRDTIGAPLGLYQRNKAGTKRKAVNDVVSHETQNEAKRSKGDTSSSSTDILATVNRPTSVFGAPNDLKSGSSTTVQPDASAPSSSTSNMFKSLISPPNSEPTTAKATPVSASPFNPFGSLDTPTSSVFASSSTITAKAPQPSASNSNPFGSFNISTSSSFAPSSTKTTTEKPVVEPAVASNPFAFLNLPNDAPKPVAAAFSAPKSSTAPSQAANPFASFNTQKPNLPNPTSIAPSESIFKPSIPSTTPTKSPPKPSAFQVPTFGGGASINFMDAFSKQSQASAAKLEAEEKRKRKAEDFDSDEDDEAEYDRKYEEEQRAKRNKLEALAKAGSARFQPVLSKDNTSAGAAPFSSNSFASPARNNSSVLEQPSPPNPLSASDHIQESPLQKGTKENATNARNSDEEELEEDQNSSEGADVENEDAEGEADEDYDSEANAETDHGHNEEMQDEEFESDDDDLQAAMAKSRGKSLFDRIEPNPNLNNDGSSKKSAEDESKKPNGVSANSYEIKSTPNDTRSESSSLKGGFGASGSMFGSTSFGTPKAPTWSPFTPVNVNGAKGGLDSSALPEKRDDSSSLTPNPATKDPSAPASTIFSTKPKASPSAQPFSIGGSTSLASDNFPPGTGLFGSRPGTPSSAESSGSSIFAGIGNKPTSASPQGDNTWKPGTPIKFGTPSTAAPTVSVTAATPPLHKDDSAAPKPFSNLFGGAGTPSKPPPSNTGSVGFGFGLPSASPLLGPSLVGSAVSSRATSPGATDTESVGTDTEDHSNDPQASFMNSRPGEENEDVLFEARSKALKLMNAEQVKGTQHEPGWVTQGVGSLRVLKDKTTEKVRIILRAEPGSNIVINTALSPSMEYKSQETKGSGAVRFGIPTNSGVESWVMKVKTGQMADELASVLEREKGTKN